MPSDSKGPKSHMRKLESILMPTFRRLSYGETAKYTASEYDKWAPEYDTCINPTRDLDTIVLRRQQFHLDGKAVVEFGCGTGRHTEFFANNFGEGMLQYTAVDVSKGMLAKARERIASSPRIAEVNKEKIKFLEHDLTKPWPMRTDSVDLMFGDLVLEHLQTLDMFFKEASRTVKAGGVLFICEYHPYKKYNGGKPGTQDGQVIAEPPAFNHDVSTFVNKAMENGFSLYRMDEWRDAGKEEGPPNVFSVKFVRNEKD